MGRPRLPLSLFLLQLLLLDFALAQPARLPFRDCFSGKPEQKLQVSDVYAQILDHSTPEMSLDLTVFGSTSEEILGSHNDSQRLSTLFTSTELLTLDVDSSSIYLCSPLMPPSPLPEPEDDINAPPDNRSYCPMAPGQFALSTTVKLGDHRALTTLNTRVRAVDPFGDEILCLDVATTPLNPGKNGSIYGESIYIFWGTVALAIAYWVVVGLARISSAWGRGLVRQKGGVWEKIESAGLILASAVSGERFAHAPSLMRYCTPSLRDIIFHSQWCSVLAMVAVQWPSFVYPLLRQTAWSTLAYNISVVPNADKQRWDPLDTEGFTPPEAFSEQIADINSPLYMSSDIPNTLFLLPDNATDGMASFAYTIGLRPENLWSTSMITFLGILAGAIALSLLIWLTDWLASLVGKQLWGKGHTSTTRSTDIKHSASARDNLGSPPLGASHDHEENKSLNSHHLLRTGSRFSLPLGPSTSSKPARKGWWRVHTALGSFHGSFLHGNLVRILVLFYLPITIFSSYEMTYPRDQIPVLRIALAAVSFVVFSILIPAWLVLRVRFTSTNKLYDETRTLLAFGPLYNHYRHGSQMFASLFFATNFALGVTIGCGQKSGTAQAIVILVVEVTSALVTSIWLPWAHGASMGLISFLFCVARIVIAVLLVILAPAISIGVGAGGWVAYGILIILALVFLALVLMLLAKILEGIVRICSFIGFEHSKHVVDSGLLGVLGLLGCCGSRRRSRSSRKRNGYRPATAHHQDSASEAAYFASPSITTHAKGSSSYIPGPTPSVLRPEHALQPYKEDGDDESGFIMNAWRSPGSRGYSPVSDTPSPKPSTGFSRVGGGRAHHENPYAITPGSSKARNQLLHAPVFNDDDDDDSPATSFVSDARRPELSNLPSGAMNPLRARTKSQSGIIEDSSSYLGVSPEQASSAPRDESVSKRPWYQFKRKERPRSVGDDVPVQASNPSLDPPKAAGRSFVVVRKGQQAKPAQESSDELQPPSSFGRGSGPAARRMSATS